MSDMLDVSSISTYTSTSADKPTYTGDLIGNLATGSNTLTTEDFYQLMAVQIQNQTMDDTYDTNQFMDQMMQMAIIDAIDVMTTTSITQYAASMVGKEVTVGVVDAAGNVEEIVGEVTATGVLEGTQVIFIDGTAYTLSQIMAIGRLPEADTETDTEGEDDGTVDGVDPDAELDGSEGTTGTEGDTELDGSEGTTGTGTDSDTTLDGSEGTTGTDTDDTLDGSEGTTSGDVDDTEFEDVFEEENSGAVEGTGNVTDDTLDGSEGTTGGNSTDDPDENNDGESTEDSGVTEIPPTDEA
ncbi:MAG: hypothetical protein R3Y53_01745 [Bacillota bacterium]